MHKQASSTHSINKVKFKKKRRKSWMSPSMNNPTKPCNRKGNSLNKLLEVNQGKGFKLFRK